MALVTWLLFILLSLTTLLILPLALKRRRFIPAALALLGALLSFGLVSLATGIGEHVWTITSPSALLAAAIGLTGLTLFILGITKILGR